MHPIDILFWACLMLGGVYTLFNLFMGGLSHAAGHMGQIGHALHLPQIHDVAGHVGAHAEIAQTTASGAHALPGHAHAPHAHVSHSPAHARAATRGPSGRGGRADVEEAGSGFSILAYLNPLAVAGFLLGFGGAGVLIGLLNPDVSLALRIAYSVASGWGLWLVAYLIATRVFGFAEGTSHNRQEQCIGLPANVTAPISGRQPGMISYTVAGSRQTLRAISEDVEPIAVGSMVRIRRIDANTALVTLADQPLLLNTRKG